MDDQLCGIGSADRAYIGTCAAFNAGIRIDDVGGIALGDCADGAFSLACAAADAFIINNVSHNKHLQVIVDFIVTCKP